MQTIRNTRNSLEARLASWMPAGAGVTVTFGTDCTGFAHGANLCPAVTAPSRMQCSGGRISGPGDDV